MRQLEGADRRRFLEGLRERFDVKLRGLPQVCERFLLRVTLAGRADFGTFRHEPVGFRVGIDNGGQFHANTVSLIPAERNGKARRPKHCPHQTSPANRRFLPFSNPRRSFHYMPLFIPYPFLNWAVYPLVMEFDPHNLDKNIELALKTLLGRQLLHRGNTVVVVSSISAGDQVVDAVQMRVV
jgi:hypothetical protein